MENKLKAILLNEQKEIQIRYWIKVRLELLSKLAGIDYQHVKLGRKRYSQKLLDEDLKKLSKISFDKLIKFKF